MEDQASHFSCQQDEARRLGLRSIAVVSEALKVHVLAVVREAPASMAHHVRRSRAEIDLRVEQEVVLVV